MSIVSKDHLSGIFISYSQPGTHFSLEYLTARAVFQRNNLKTYFLISWASALSGLKKSCMRSVPTALRLYWPTLYTVKSRIEELWGKSRENKLQDRELNVFDFIFETVTAISIAYVYKCFNGAERKYFCNKGVLRIL